MSHLVNTDNDYTQQHYNFGLLDENTKREIRRVILKAIAVPGFQVPFVSRELPIFYGWGTGGLQITLSIIGRKSILKIIDQGDDDSVNAVNLRRLVQKTTGVETTEDTTRATIIQTRHRIPEEILRSEQALVYQVPLPEPLRNVEPRETDLEQDGRVRFMQSLPIQALCRFLWMIFLSVWKTLQVNGVAFAAVSIRT